MKTLVGIDIGADSLKLALVQGRKVRGTAIAAMPQNLLRDGHIVSPETVAELIRNTLYRRTEAYALDNPGHNNFFSHSFLLPLPLPLFLRQPLP